MGEGYPLQADESVAINLSVRHYKAASEAVNQG
jgi:hypothetical protein